MIAAKVMKGKTVHPDVSFCILPGSRQVYEMIAKNGALADLIAAGTRILETACGPCIGMGQAPRSGAVTVRTFNRNFKGRCGTKDAGAYLVSPETAAWIAVSGKFMDPRENNGYPEPEEAEPEVDDSMIIKPPETGNGQQETEIARGPNIKPLPELKPLEDSLKKEVLLKVGDDITTDHIMPAGAKILPLRSNIPAISEFVFSQVDAEFPKRAQERGGGIIVGGENYGQGSSREHAAIAPLYLGVRAVIAKSWARIHKKNLVNWGIVPLTFIDAADYEKIEQGEVVELPGLKEELKSSGEITVKTNKGEFKVKADLGPKSTEVLLEGGLINYTKKTHT
jgi:aconitate hydratase